MPADTNRKTEARAAPAPGNYRTAPTTGRQKATAKEPTWVNSTSRRLRPISDKSIYDWIVVASSEFVLLHCTLGGAFAFAAAARHAVFRRGQKQTRRQERRRRRDRTAVLFYEISADLAGSRVLIACTAAATDRTDQLAVFDERKSARACD